MAMPSVHAEDENDASGSTSTVRLVGNDPRFHRKVRPQL